MTWQTPWCLPASVQRPLPGMGQLAGRYVTVLLMPACLAAETTGPPSGHGRAAGRRSQCHFCRLPGRWAIDTGLPSLHMADTGRLLVRVICWLAGRCPPANHSCVVDKSASSLGRAAPPCRPHRGQQQHTVLGLLPSPSLLAAAAVQSLTARHQLCSFANWRLQQSAITKRHSSHATTSLTGLMLCLFCHSFCCQVGATPKHKSAGVRSLIVGALHGAAGLCAALYSQADGHPCLLLKVWCMWRMGRQRQLWDLGPTRPSSRSSAVRWRLSFAPTCRSMCSQISASG